MTSYPGIYTPPPIGTESKQRVLSELYNNLKVVKILHGAYSWNKSANIRPSQAQMSSTDSGQAASGRIETLLQSLLEGMQQLESKVSAQSEQIQGLQSGLEGLKNGLVQRAKQASNQINYLTAVLTDVVSVANEERARREKAASQQSLFIKVLRIVVVNGFDKDVLVCLSLGRAMWNDMQLWRVVIDRKYKHRERTQKKTVPEEDLDSIIDENLDENYVVVKYVETRLIRACRVGRESTVRRLLRLRANIHIADKGGNRALSMASWKGRPNLVKAFLAEGSEVDHVSKIGLTALIWAARNGCVECLNALLKAEAWVDHASKDGRTGLMFAAQNGHIDCLRALIDAEADVDLTDCDGESALVKAAWEGHALCVLALLDAKASVDLSDNGNWSALLWATQEGHFEVVRMLVEYGADVNHRGKNGDSCLSLAKAKKHLEVAAFLKERIAQSPKSTVNSNGKGKSKSKHGRGG